jgi:hypothetical protein
MTLASPGILFIYNLALRNGTMSLPFATNKFNFKIILNGNMVASTPLQELLHQTLLYYQVEIHPQSKYFKGKIDEVRVFNVALRILLQRMVYQEIQNFSSEIRGTIVPKNIAYQVCHSLIYYGITEWTLIKMILLMT